MRDQHELHSAAYKGLSKSKHCIIYQRFCHICDIVHHTAANAGICEGIRHISRVGKPNIIHLNRHTGVCFASCGRIGGRVWPQEHHDDFAFCNICPRLTAFSPNFATLLVMRGLLGFFLAGVPAIAMTYVGEEFDPKGLGKMMGLYISGTSLGGMSGRLLTGLLTDLFGWRDALAIIGIICFVLSYLFWVFLPQPRHSARKQTNLKKTRLAYRTVFVNGRLMLLISLGFILMGSFVTMFNYIGFQLMGPPYRLSQTIIGLIFIV